MLKYLILALSTFHHIGTLPLTAAFSWDYVAATKRIGFWRKDEFISYAEDHGAWSPSSLLGRCGPLRDMKKTTLMRATPKRSVTSLWYRDRDETEEQMTLTQLKASVTSSSSERGLEGIQESSGQVGQAMFKTGAVNLPLVRATCKSHAMAFSMAMVVLSLALAWNTGFGSLDVNSLHWNANTASAISAATSQNFHSLFDWTMTPARMLEGVLATFPLVAMCNMVMEHSESRPACHVHFSITNTVIALFGRRRGTAPTTASSSSSTTSTLQVLLFSLGIATVSAVCEEMIFRGLLPVVLVSFTHSVGLALVGQALLFGLGQIRRQSSLTENGAFGLMQSIQGLWYGSVYLVTGGDILPVILAHILYECHIFVGAWKSINDQMDYTESATTFSLYRPPSTKSTAPTASNQESYEELELQKIRKEAGASLSRETFEFCRRFFYAFDNEHRGTLSQADVKRAVTYAFLHDDQHEQPSNAKVEKIFQEIIERRHTMLPGHARLQEEEDRLSMSEFLRLLFALKSKKWKNQLE